MLKVDDRQKHSPGQRRLPLDQWERTDPEIRRVAEKFVMAMTRTDLKTLVSSPSFGLDYYSLAPHKITLLLLPNKQ